MEDVVLRIPASDVALVMQFANRMGWMITNKQNLQPYTWDEARERIAIAKQQFASGQFQSHEDVMQKR